MAVQMMGQNLRGEMISDLAGARLCLSDSRFIQIIAKSLSISNKEVSGLRFTVAGRFSIVANVEVTNDSFWSHAT